MADYDPADIEMDPVVEEPTRTDDYDPYDETIFDGGDSTRPYDGGATGGATDNLPDTIDYNELRSFERRRAKADFYNELLKQGYTRSQINIDALLENRATLEIIKAGGRENVYIRFEGRTIRITPETGTKPFLALSSIAREYGPGGTDFVRNVLGISE